MTQAEVICVLGMHRSGTSAVARLVNLLGVYLGPEENLVKPGFDNPKGFWEHRELTDLNEKILNKLGGDHLRPPRFLPGWEKSAELDAIRLRAQSVISRDFDAADLWGWKDPRNCLTLAFWQPLLPKLKYVVCLRNPVDVARSLEKRNGLNFAAGIQLWLTHVTSAVEHTAGAPRIFVFFEDLMENVQDELARLSYFLGKPELSKNAPIKDKVEEFIERELHHHQTSVTETLSQSQLAFPVQALHLVLRLYVSLQKSTGVMPEGFLEEALREAVDAFAARSVKPYSHFFERETQAAKDQAQAGSARSQEIHQELHSLHEPVAVQDSTLEDHLEITFVSHDAGRAGAQRLLLTLIEWLRDQKALRAKIILRRGGILADEFRRLGEVLEIEPQLAVGMERLKPQILEFCRDSALIYVNTLVPGDIAEILSTLQIPLVTHAHEMPIAIQRWCAVDDLASLLRVTDQFIAAAPAVAENLELNYGVDSKRLTTVKSFIRSSAQDIRAGDKNALRRAQQLPEKGFIVFGCGTTEWRKAPDLFIEVARRVVTENRLEDIYFFWIGSDAVDLARPRLEERIVELGLDDRVAFLGEVVDPRSLFSAGDVFLLTSREDPFPLVCLEAADCGLPIICFEGAGGMPDFVKEDAGFVVPFERTDLMADRLLFLYSNPEELSRSGAVACRRVRSQHDVSTAGEQIFREIMVAIIQHQRLALVGKAVQVTLTEQEHKASMRKFDELSAMVEAQRRIVETKDAQIAELGVNRDVLAQRVVTLETELGLFAEKMASIEAAVAASDQALDDKDTRITSLEVESAALAERAVRLETALSSAHSEIGDRDQRIHAMELAQSGLLWRLIIGYRGVKDRCLPAGTGRRELYDKILGVVKSRAKSLPEREINGGDVATETFPVSSREFLYSIDSLALRAGRVYGWGWLLHKTEDVQSLRMLARTRKSLHVIECQYGVRRDDVSRTHEQAGARNSGFLILSRLPEERLLELFFEVELTSGRVGRIYCEDLELLAQRTQLDVHSVINGRPMNGTRKLVHYGRRGIGYLARRDWRGLQAKIQKKIEQSRINGSPLPVFSLRDFLAHIAPYDEKEYVLLIDHNLGGGANIYRAELITENLDSGRPVLLLFYNLWRLQYCLQYLDRERDMTFVVESLDSIVALASSVHVKEIFLNNTVSFDDPLTIAALLPHLKRTSGAELTIAIHDYFAVCPSWNLLDSTGRYCGVPSISRCRECLPKLGRALSFWVDGKTIDQWRNLWGCCLQEATRILCFSHSSIDLLCRAYPDLESVKIKYQPHSIEDFPRGKIQSNVHANLNIGIVGEITATKGAAVVAEMVRLIMQQKLPVKITVIGTIEGVSESDIVSITGPYKRQHLPATIARTEANVFFVPSIWPETFSFVTAELMQMELPVACFDLGAQAERVRTYARGLVIGEMSSEAALDRIIAFHAALSMGADAKVHEDLQN